ncbi:MAG TPA: hypothetical protein VEO95_02725 [Chthoniobacteraceae bacterium]|nr:hypothetical protein [Chthoniobacteraceae bacterium]
MKRFAQLCGLVLCLATSGCAQRTLYFQYTRSHPPPEPAVDAFGNPLSRPELTPDGRVVKKMDVRSDPQGAFVVVRGFFVGETPIQVEVPCTASGRFIRTTKLRLLPTLPGQLVQSKIFPAGSRVPSRIIFSTQPIVAGRVIVSAYSSPHP